MLRGARWVIVAACLADVRFGRFVRTPGTVLCPVVGRRDPGWIVAVFLLFLLRVLHVLQVPGRGVLMLSVLVLCVFGVFLYCSGPPSGKFLRVSLLLVRPLWRVCGGRICGSRRAWRSCFSCCLWRARRSSSDPGLGFGGWGRPVRMAHLHVRRCVVGVCSPLREAVGRVACAPGSRLFVAHPQSTCVLNASGVISPVSSDVFYASFCFLCLSFVLSPVSVSVSLPAPGQASATDLSWE